jgi:hypothetical protein
MMHAVLMTQPKGKRTKRNEQTQKLTVQRSEVQFPVVKVVNMVEKTNSSQLEVEVPDSLVQTKAKPIS